MRRNFQSRHKSVISRRTAIIGEAPCCHCGRPRRSTSSGQQRASAGSPRALRTACELDADPRHPWITVDSIHRLDLLCHQLLVGGRDRNVARLSGLNVRYPVGSSDRLWLHQRARRHHLRSHQRLGGPEPSATLARYLLVAAITGLQLLGVATSVQQLFYRGTLVMRACRLPRSHDGAWRCTPAET